MERKYKSFAFTVRQKNGNTEEVNNSFLTYIKKQNGGAAVLEKEGNELHMHACVFLQNETTKTNFNHALSRIYERVRGDEDSIKVLRSGTRIMFNMDWWTNYCKKESDPKILYENIPNDVETYFPSEDEQKSAKLKAVDSVLAELEFLIKEEESWVSEPNHIDYAMYSIWFKKKLRKAPREKKKKREICEDLKKWMFPDEFTADW